MENNTTEEQDSTLPESSTQVEMSPNELALINHAYNLMRKCINHWKEHVSENKRYRTASLAIQANKNVLLKRTVFKVIRLINEKRQGLNNLELSLMLIETNYLYKRSLEAWKQYTDLAKEKRSKTARKGQILEGLNILESFELKKSLLLRKTFLQGLKEILEQDKEKIKRIAEFRRKNLLKMVFSDWNKYHKYKTVHKGKFIQSRVIWERHNKKLIRNYFKQWRQGCAKENLIMESFKEKYMSAQKKQPKKLPNFDPKDLLHIRPALNETSQLSIVKPYISDKEEIIPERNGEDSDQASPELNGEYQQETEEEFTQEDLDEAVQALEVRLKEIKRNKERIKTLEDKGKLEEDEREVKILSKVLERQKLEAKGLLEDIKGIKEYLGI